MTRRLHWFGMAGLIGLMALFALAPIAGAAPLRQATDSIDVDDQAVKDGTVIIAEVNSSQDGWIAVHIDKDGKPGPVIGHAAAPKGETYKIAVKLEQPVAAGAKLWPMLHIDAGKIGTYEFPGPDAPVVVNNDIVMKQITVTASEGKPVAGQPAAEATAIASIDADDQPLTNGGVVVAEVSAVQDGWIAVHIDKDGKPGPVIGHAAAPKGETYKIAVKLEQPVAVGAKLWPMLHIDAGKIGTYEFPGPDSPVVVDGNIVMKQISITAAAAAPAKPTTMPATGGEGLPIGLIVSALAIVIAGSLLKLRSRA
jgi:hypothetical protein